MQSGNVIVIDFDNIKNESRVILLENTNEKTYNMEDRYNEHKSGIQGYALFRTF